CAKEWNHDYGTTW
nr:immunoglobulin heavy chain junction region [Macaca mulatta]